MHLLSTRPGGYIDDGGQGVVRVQQTPGDIVILSAADTTLSLLSDAAQQLPGDFPRVRLANLMWLRQPASTDGYLDDVLRHARAIVIDHLGGHSEWAYLVEQVQAQAQRLGQWVAFFSGDHNPDEQLVLRSSAAALDCHQLWRYLREGGRSNALAFYALIAHAAFGQGPRPPPPLPLPQVWAYESAQPLPEHPDAPLALLLFYRAHAQSGNTAVFDALLLNLWQQGLNTRALALDSLKTPSTLAAVQALAQQAGVDVVLNATSFAIVSLEGASASESPVPVQLAGDAPVLQLILAGGAKEQWEQDPHGLTPRDLAMHVVLPEVDGRLCTRAVSFKGLAHHCARTEVDVVRYQPEPERIAFVAELARRWCSLRHTPAADKRIALILANYPHNDARLANGVGLDTPASTVAILQALQAAGYDLGPAEAVPQDSSALMQRLVQGVTNDLAANAYRPAFQSLALADYLADFHALAPASQDAVNQLWGPPAQDPMLRAGRFMVPGVRLGKVFVGIQPARGRDLDVVARYHDADLVPPHAYLAFYAWLRRTLAVDAVVHVGKHGNLEWLPGKSVALGAHCWPDAVLGPLPHLYPFIVNDPGEGSQAKRRSQAVIIDHLMPALTRAESYGPLQALERSMDEYYDALQLDPRRATHLRRVLLAQVLECGLHHELGFAAPTSDTEREQLLTRLDAYLCEIKEAQIRDGLHTFGQSPQGRQRSDTLLALVRHACGTGAGQGGLLAALAHDLGLSGFDPLTPDWAAPWQGPRPAVLKAVSEASWRHAGHTRERLEGLALHCVQGACVPATWTHTVQVLARMTQHVAPRLDESGANELRQLLRGLDGRWVPAGPSGAPSRGRPDVLPTGRNFYSVDTRAVPTPMAYEMGRMAAQAVIERHLQDHGSYPESVGLSVWGTSTMRTGGEDIAQALALLGVRPKWAPGSNRVVDVEVLPQALAQHPRVDVTLRVSGFFRDAFPNVIALFDSAVQAVAAISADDEDDQVNPIRARVHRDAAAAQAQGATTAQAQRQASWRIFGPRPGGYGAGLQELIASGRWQERADLGQAYLRAGAFAYGQDSPGLPAPVSLAQRLASVQAVLHNQDNREHDILDSDDYYQFHGGMAAAVEHLSGTLPALYHGDLSVPGAPRIRSLTEEIARVVRARAVNPKWLQGVKRHGYKGAFEMAATVDYLFAFDAVANVVADHQYALVAQAYVHDDATRAFLQEHNPQALHAIAERLLEALHRGQWVEPGDQGARLKEHLLALEQQWEEGSP